MFFPFYVVINSYPFAFCFRNNYFAPSVPLLHKTHSFSSYHTFIAQFSSYKPFSFPLYLFNFFVYTSFFIQIIKRAHSVASLKNSNHNTSVSLEINILSSFDSSDNSLVSPSPSFKWKASSVKKEEESEETSP